MGEPRPATPHPQEAALSQTLPTPSPAPHRLPRPRAGGPATILFLAALALSAASAHLIEPADAGPAAQAAAPAR